MSEQVLSTQQSNPDIRSPRPLLQRGRVEVVVCRGSIVQQHNRDLTTLERNNFRVLRCADHIVVVHDRAQALPAKEGLTIGGGVGKVLPRFPGFTVIDGLLQRPQAGSGRVAHPDEQIGHVEFLSKVDRQIDLVVLHATGQRWTLPPVFRSVGSILGRMTLVRVTRFADVTNLSLDNLVLVLVIVFGVGSDQLAVQLVPVGAHATGGGCGDFAAFGQIKVRWGQFGPDQRYCRK